MLINMLRWVLVLVLMVVCLTQSENAATRIVSVTLMSSVSWQLVRYDLNLDSDRHTQARNICEINLGVVNEDNYGTYDDCIEQMVCHMLQFDDSTPETCMKRYDASLPDYVISATLKTADTHLDSNIIFGDAMAAAAHKPLYSSFRCVGGSQHIADTSILRHTPSKFPKYDSQYRHCMFTNVCFMFDAKYPTMAYFRHPSQRADNPSFTAESASRQSSTGLRPVEVPHDYRLESQSARLLQVGALSGQFTSANGKSFLPLHYVDAPLDAGTVHVEDRFVAFVGSPSWPNYGHYLIDHVLPTFAAAGLWDIPLSNVLQVLDNSCLKMKKVNPYLAHSMNRSITNQEYCLQLYQGLSHHFFDQAPLFLDETISTDTVNKKVCFRKAIIGQNSALGANTTDLSRAHWLRKFRDHVVSRLAPVGDDSAPVGTSPTTSTASWSATAPKQRAGKQQIFVSYKGAGLLKNDEQMSSFNTQLCDVVQRAHQLLLQEVSIPTESSADTSQHTSVGQGEHTNLMQQRELASEYSVRCGAVYNISFEEEVRVAQATSILVTHDGTISYTSLFLADNSEVLVVSPTKPQDTYKENQYFMWATHFHVYWVQEERIQQVSHVAGILLQAMINRLNFA